MKNPVKEYQRLDKAATDAEVTGRGMEGARRDRPLGAMPGRLSRPTTLDGASRRQGEWTQPGIRQGSWAVPLTHISVQVGVWRRFGNSGREAGIAPIREAYSIVKTEDQG